MFQSRFLKKLVVRRDLRFWDNSNSKFPPNQDDNNALRGIAGWDCRFSAYYSPEVVGQSRRDHRLDTLL
jgi:hypothetical protein